MTEEKFPIETIRHSLSHVLAAAVLELFPNAKLGIGPAIENGFYYDFDMKNTLKDDDLAKIEKLMREIINKGLPFGKSIISISEVKKLFSDQKYKIELINDLEKDGEKEVSIYKLGSFTDLCKGPHVESTKELKDVGWKLSRIAGAYWKSDEKKAMLQRIYGLAFESKEALEKYEKFLLEAEKRDHKKLGREMDLYFFDSSAPGQPFWQPKGMVLWNQLQNFGQEMRKKYGFIEIKTPLLAKNSLWITSGHWDHYKDSMFHFELDGETYCIKPMDCPFNIKIYQSKVRSYKELPIRYTEIGHVYRNEKSGELNGLLRVQEITQDDSHIFARENQVKNEIVNLLNMTKEYYAKLGLEPEFNLSTRPDDFLGEIKTWDKAENDLKDALQSENIQYGIKEKDGAFYGPKIDIHINDALKRSWQVATIQLDFQLPGRFDCKYIDEEGKEIVPVMIHAAVFGAFERMIGILMENYGGALPIWMTPVQAIVLPIADRHNDYAKQVQKELEEKNIRVDLDDRSESIGKKIREAEIQKIPYMLIVGDKEIEAKKVAIRKYGEGDRGQTNIAEIIADITKE